MKTKENIDWEERRFYAATQILAGLSANYHHNLIPSSFWAKGAVDLADHLLEILKNENDNALKTEEDEQATPDSYWKEHLAEISEHIMRDCAPGDCAWNRKGLIVADDKTGEVLASVKDALKYDGLKAAGKINDITVDKSCMDTLDKCWAMLLTEARKINHGLLVIKVKDDKLFRFSWCIKQLAKQEDPTLGFDGYVLLVIEDTPWDQVRKNASDYNKGEFDAMMGFYHRIVFEN